MLAEDFNCLLADEERISKIGASTLFNNWVQTNGMIDLGFIGNEYTWRHGTNVETRKAARLNRALSCDVWRRRFSSASVQHLRHAHSDHYPLLVELDGARTARLGERPFKFQAT